MIDAVSGAIYVIGGRGGLIFYKDVWASTDGGAQSDSRGGWSAGGRGVLPGYFGVTLGYCRY